MTQNLPLAALILGALAIALVIAWWIETATTRPQAAKAFNGVDSQGVKGEAEPWTHVEDDGLLDEDLWAHVNDAATSNLTRAAFNRAVDVGVDVLRADVTGRGRMRWESYWSEGAGGLAADRCCHRVTVHAATADKHPSGDVVVTVVWSSERGRQTLTRIQLERAASGWRPVVRSLQEVSP